MGSYRFKPDRGKNPGRLSFVSLSDKRAVGSILRAIGHTSVAHTELRGKVFKEMVNSTRLQHIALGVLSKHPKIAKDVIRELAKNPQLRRKFLLIAGLDR